MTQITPDKPVGFRTVGMIVLICPTCGQKRWANKRKVPGTARTTCCGASVEYIAPKVDNGAPGVAKNPEK